MQLVTILYEKNTCCDTRDGYIGTIYGYVRRAGANGRNVSSKRAASADDSAAACDSRTVAGAAFGKRRRWGRRVNSGTAIHADSIPNTNKRRAGVTNSNITYSDRAITRS